MSLEVSQVSPARPEPGPRAADTPARIFRNPFTQVSPPHGVRRILELAGLILLSVGPLSSLWTLPRILGWQVALIRRVSTGTPGLPSWRQPLWRDGTRVLLHVTPWALVPLLLLTPLFMIPWERAPTVFILLLCLCYTVWLWGIIPPVLIAAALTRRVVTIPAMFHHLGRHGAPGIAISALLTGIGLLAAAPLSYQLGMSLMSGCTFSIGGVTGLLADTIPAGLGGVALFQYLIILPGALVCQVLAAGQWLGRLAQRQVETAPPPAPPPE